MVKYNYETNKHSLGQEILGMDKKQAILKAGFEIFCEKGYHLSVAELAGAVNIKTPSLYSHFQSKDEIIELMIRDEIEGYYSGLSQTMRTAGTLSCQAGMKRLYDFMIEYFSKFRRIRFWRSIPFIPNQALNRLCRELIQDNDRIFKQQLEKHFARGQANGEISPDVSPGALRLYLCMIQGVLDGLLLSPEATEDARHFEELFAAYWDGISVKQSSQDQTEN